MDRTTLSRILKPLEQAKLVRRAGSADRRERLLRLSAEGERRLKLSYARWEEAQREFESHIGPSALKRLRDSLKAAEKAAGEASI
jgi:DNA-binding MarR family transcriptional regulator